MYRYCGIKSQLLICIYLSGRGREGRSGVDSGGVATLTGSIAIGPVGKNLCHAV